jgi:tetratricopeptide (TPR) repeat protein
MYKKNRDRMIKYILKILVSLVIFTWIYAGDGDGQAGTRSPFTEFGFGARSMGLGNAYVALADDPTAVHWNPAGLDYIYQQSVTFFHASLYLGTPYSFIGYAYPTLDLGTFAIGIGRLGVGDIIETDAYYNEYEQKFSWEKYRAYISYGLKLPWDLAAGLSLKVERSSFGTTVRYGKDVGVGVGMDLGLMYRPGLDQLPFLEDMSFGLNLINLFPLQMKEGEGADIVPLTFKFGIMRKLRFFGPGHGVNILLDFDKSKDTDFGICFGTEYSFRDMGMIRLGYTGEVLAFGAGAKYSIFQIDYAFGDPSTESMLGIVHRISLSINFGMNRDEMYDIVQQKKRQEEEKIIAEIRDADKQKFIAEHLQKADVFFKDTKYLDAVVEYQQVLGMDPFHQHANIMLDSSNVLLEKEFTYRQNIAVQEAIDKDRASADSTFINEHFEKGRLALDKKDFTQALIEFNLALARNPSNQSVINAIETTRRRLNEELNSLVQRARVEFRDENYSEALRLLADARVLSANDPRVLNEVDALVRRIKIQENIQKALMLYDIEEYEEALVIFKEILEENPNNQFIREYYDKSRIEAYATKEPMDPDTERKYLEGVDKFLLGKYKEAIKIWEEIIKEHPNNKRVLEAIKGANERLKRARSK